jgi:hypothetical protein
MYLIDVGAPTTGQRYTYSVVFSLVKYGAPEGTRTPNLLICSRKQAHHQYVQFGHGRAGLLGSRLRMSMVVHSR